MGHGLLKLLKWWTLLAERDMKAAKKALKCHCGFLGFKMLHDYD